MGRSGVATLLVVVVGVVVGTCSSLLQILPKLYGVDSAGLDVGLTERAGQSAVSSQQFFGWRIAIGEREGRNIREREGYMADIRNGRGTTATPRPRGKGKHERHPLFETRDWLRAPPPHT